MALILPIPPYQKREVFVRNNKEFTAVEGINEQGFAYLYIEETELDPPGLTVRWVVADQYTKFVHGVNIPVETYWEKELYLNGKYVQTVEGSRVCQTTNHPDMIDFTAHLGTKITKYIANGFVRSVLGHDTQPLYRPNMETGSIERVPDIEYDTAETPTESYDDHKAEEDGTAI